jgi:GT2 family glycosyltransferase
VTTAPDRERQLAEEAAARAGIERRAAVSHELPPTSKTVGAVVVTFNDEAHVTGMLRHLLKEVAEIVVCDLGSSDRTLALVAERCPGVRRHQLPLEAGFAAAINEGARLLGQPFLLILHGDARLRPGALERLHGQLHAGGRRAACCGPRITAPDGTVELSAGFRPTVWRRWRAWWRTAVPRSRRARKRPPRLAYGAPPILAEVDWVSCAAALLRREAFDDVHGMDEGFFLAWADVDLGLRLRRTGWRTYCEPRARAIHLDRVEESAESRRRARRRFARKHGLVARLRRAS